MRTLSILSKINYSAECRHGVGCQSPDNCSKQRRFGGHVTSTDIKHKYRILISEHPPILCWWRLLPEHVEVYVYWLCYCVASCYRYLMLINHPTDGATRGLALRVCLLGRKTKINLQKIFVVFVLLLLLLFVERTVRIIR